jgi:hypothetical protein
MLSYFVFCGFYFCRQMMLEENKRVRSKIPAAFEALMGLHLAKVDDVMEPGLTTLSWSSTQIADYIHKVRSLA